MPHRLNLPAALLLAALISSLSAMISGVIVRALPAWRPGYLVLACFVVAVEATLIRYRMRRDRDLIASSVRYLAAEIFALAALMRAVASLSFGLDSLPAAARAWLRSPLDALDEPFIACLAAGLVVGLLVRGGMAELDELEPHGPSRPPDHTIDTDVYRSGAASRQQQALARLSTGLAWGGAAALVALVAQVVNVSRGGGPPLPLEPAMGVAAMVYLICAVVLYSRARLGLLMARWHLDGSEVEPGVRRGWGRSSVAIIIAVASLTLFLPRSYGLALLDAMRGSGLIALSILSVIIVNLGLLAITILGLLLSIPAYLLSLLGLGGPDDSQPPVAPQLPEVPLEPQVVREPPLLPAIVFWACVAILAGYALYIVARRQGWVARAAAALRAGPLGRLWAALGELWRGTRVYAGQVGEVLAERARQAAEAAPRQLLRLRGLAPGELVRYFYLSTLRRAAERGVGRRRAQTPREYEAQLRGHLPEAAEDMAQLTDAYEAAAYAPRPVLPDDAQRARGPWRRLRRLLRRGG